MPDAESVYLFRHAIVRDAAYGLFPPAERVGLHRSAISSYEELFTDGLDTHAEELLQHARSGLALAESGEADSLLALEYRYLRLAADFCAQSWRIHDESRYLKQLQNHPVASNPERAEYLLRRAHHMYEQSSLETAEKLADAAVQYGERDTRTNALYLRYLTRYEGGKLDGDEELGDLLHQLSQGQPSLALMRAQLGRATTHERNAEHDKADLCFNRAVEIARELGHPDAIAEALFERGLTYHRVGRSEEGHAAVTEALEIARHIDDKKLEMMALNRLGIILVENSRLEEAAASYEHAREIAHAIGAKATEATIANNLANLHFYFFGDLSKAEQVYLQSLEFFVERNEIHAIAHANGVLGLMYHAAGEFEPARRCFRIVREQARIQNDRVMEAKAHMGLAFCPVSWSDVAATMEGYRLAIQHLRAAPSGITLSRTWATLAANLTQQGYIRAGGEALEIAQNQKGVEGFQSTVIDGFVARHNLLVGDRESVDPKHLRVDPDRPPLDSVSYGMTDRFIYEAGNGASRERLQELRDEIMEVACTFEALRYARVRDALRLVEATVQAGVNDPKWRGLALSGLPKGLANALANPDTPQPGLNELLPGLDELRVPVSVK